MSERRPIPFKTLLDSDVATLIEAAEDVYQIRFKNRAANAYLVRGSKRTIMIDVGLSSNYPHLLTCLAHLGVTPDNDRHGGVEPRASRPHRRRLSFS